MSKLGEILENQEHIDEPNYEAEQSNEDPLAFEMKSMEEIRQEINAKEGAVIARQFVELSCFSKYPANPDILIEVLSKRQDYFSKQCYNKLMEQKNAN